MTVAFDDHHPVTVATLATVPSAMQAAVMFAVRKLCSRTAKPAVPVHIPVPTYPDAELFRTCDGWNRHCKRGYRSKNVSQFFHGFLLLLTERTARTHLRSGDFRGIS
jgi:hypothetical protein